MVRPHKPNHDEMEANTDTGYRAKAKRGRMVRQDETGIIIERNAGEDVEKKLETSPAVTELIKTPSGMAQ